MLAIGKLLGLLSLGGTFTNTVMFRKFLSGVAAVVALTIISGMMIGCLLIGLIYGVYVGFVHYGMESQAAIFSTAGIALFITLLLISSTLNHLRRLADVPRQLMQSESPLASRVSSIADAFVEGMLTREVHHPRTESR